MSKNRFFQEAVSDYTFDAAVNGTGVATYTLTGPALPDNAIITDAWIDVLTAFTTSAAAEVAVSTGQSAGDLVAAVAVSGAPFSTTGIKGTLVTFPNLGADAAHDSALEGIALVAGVKLKLTANRKPTVAVSVGALDAGKFILYVKYILSAE